MGCHIKNNLKFAVLILASLTGGVVLAQVAPSPTPVASATAAAQPLQLSFAGASNYTNLNGAIAVYYSNIYDLDSNNGFGGSGAYYAWNPTVGGGPCNPNLNYNGQCHRATDQLTITASDSQATSGSPQFWVVANGTTGVPQAGQSISVYSQVVHFGYSGKNQVINYAVPFATFCAGLASSFGINGVCNPTATAEPLEPVTMQLYIIADANGNGIIDTGEDIQGFTFVVDSSIPANSDSTSQFGIWGFQLFPGDTQAHIRSASTDSQWPASDNGTVGAQFLTFLYAAGPDIATNFSSSTTPSAAATATFNSLALAGPGQAVNYQVANLPVNTDGTLSTEYVNGLTNQVSYYFRAAITDMAGNIGFVTKAADDTPEGTSPPLPAHAVKPDQIAGLLVNNWTCFIATAAYGSPMAKEVQLFRQFRDQILMKSKAGTKFVKWYYNNGQVWADRIRDHDAIRAVVRAFLYPLLAYSWLALKIGAYNASLLFATLILLPFLVLRLRKPIKEELS